MNISPAKWRPFPELRTQEILQVMEELKLPLSESDLLRPPQPIVQRTFEGLVTLFTGSKPPTQSPFSVLALLEYPDLHSDALALALFSRAVSRLMETAGIDDFSIRDITRPDPGRFKMILSGVINFAKFREEESRLLDTLGRKADMAQSTLRSALSRRQVLQDRLSVIRAQRLQEEPEAKLLDAEIQDLVRQAKELRGTQQALQSEIRTLKASRDEANDRLSSMQFQTLQVRQECARLASQVVEDPEALSQNVSQLTAAVARERSSLLALEKDAKDANTQAITLATAIADAERAVEMARLCLEAERKRETTESNLSLLSDQQRRLSASITEAQILVEKASAMTSTSLERLEKLRSAQAARRTAYDASFATLHAEYEALSRERMAVQAKIDANDVQTKDLEAKRAEHLRAHEVEMARFLSSYRVLRQQLQQYSSDLSRVLTQ